MRNGSALDICSNAAWNLACDCRNAFVHGEMTEAEFHAKRARQDAAYEGRFKVIMTRLLAEEYEQARKDLRV